MQKNKIKKIIPSKLDKILKEYVNTLRENEFKFSRVYLYGSQATGKANKYSDIDVAIITKRTGRGQKYLNELLKLHNLTHNIDVRIEPILLEERELEVGTRSMMGYEVMKHGILIK